jgi:hypothetical protein
VKLMEIVPGDGIGMPAWPGRVTVLDVWPSDDGNFARVFWRSPDGTEGSTWLPERALVRRYWNFQAQATLTTFQPGPVPVRDVAGAMAAAQVRAGIGAVPGDEELATVAALITEG